MKAKLIILFVCGKNISRSKTAESIFRSDVRFDVKSAGLSPKSPHQLSDRDIEQADIIFVMEQSHKKQILQKHHNISNKIEVMEIDDMYKYMDVELIELLKNWVDEYLVGL